MLLSYNALAPIHNDEPTGVLHPIPISKALHGSRALRKIFSSKIIKNKCY